MPASEARKLSTISEICFGTSLKCQTTIHSIEEARNQDLFHPVILARPRAARLYRRAKPHHMHASIIDGLITAAAGVYVTLIGFGVVPSSRDKKKGAEMMKKWGVFFKFGGLFIVIWGGLNIVRGL